MFNEEFDFFDDSSEDSEHANIPKVLEFHYAPNNLSNIKTKILSQSLKFPKNKKTKGIKDINKENNEKIKINTNKTNVNNNNKLNKSSYFKPKKTSYNINKNNKEIEGKIIDLNNNKIHKDNNVPRVNTMVYEKVILKSKINENNKNVKLKRKSLMIKKQSKNKEKIKDVRLSMLENNKLKNKNNSYIKSNKKSNAISLKKTVYFIGKINEKSKNNIEKQKSEYHTRNNSHMDILDFINLELDSKFYKTMKNNNNSLISRTKTNFHCKKSDNLIKAMNLKCNSIKKENFPTFYSSKALSSFTFDCFRNKPKKFINSNKAICPKKYIIKNDKKNSVKKKMLN